MGLKLFLAKPIGSAFIASQPAPYLSDIEPTAGLASLVKNLLNASPCAPSAVPAPARASLMPAEVPALRKPSPSPAPPYAPIPAMRPLDRSPVAKAVAPPIAIPVPAAAPTPNKLPTAVPTPGANALSAKPAIAGKILFKKPASAKPVSGLIVKEPPCAIAKRCKPCSSLGVIWTRTESGPRPLAAMWLASACRLISASQYGGCWIISC